MKILALESNPAGKRMRGRRRQTWCRNVIEGVKRNWKTGKEKNF